MSVKILTSENFETVISAGGKVLVDFWAPWCGPCRMFAPVIEELASENPDIIVGKVNVDDEPEIARRFQIMSSPTLILCKDGKAVSVSVGSKSKDALEEFIG